MRSPNFPAPAPQWLTPPRLRLEDPAHPVSETLPAEALDDDGNDETEDGNAIPFDDAWPERPHDTALIGSKR